MFSAFKDNNRPSGGILIDIAERYARNVSSPRMELPEDKSENGRQMLAVDAGFIVLTLIQESLMCKSSTKSQASRPSFQHFLSNEMPRYNIL